LNLPPSDDDIPILDIAWPTATRVFILTDASVWIMDLNGNFPTFFTRPDSPALDLTLVCEINSVGLTRFLASPPLVFAASENALFRVGDGLEAVPCAKPAVAAAARPGELVIAHSDGTISRSPLPEE
jgi:hypothetical protein